MVPEFRFTNVSEPRRGSGMCYGDFTEGNELLKNIGIEDLPSCSGL